ncbi:hypothetical protein QOV31_002835 [Agrobacterium fabrum]|nr:hypothetical protein At1D132_29020 [Agrobacterium fabrum]WJK75951.1 hypothetical protein QOV31_002835 [Agrobacterium fabrum]CAD0211438.1 hypothetical protein AGTUEHA105_LOCUS2880 [Agrobacterium tumefaciens]
MTDRTKLSNVILGLVPRICNRLILFDVIRSSAQGPRGCLLFPTGFRPLSKNRTAVGRPEDEVGMIGLVFLGVRYVMTSPKAGHIFPIDG